MMIYDLFYGNFFDCNQVDAMMIAKWRFTMIKELRKRPLMTALLFVLFYAVWFVAPVLINGIQPDAKALEGIAGALKMWRSEAVTAGVLVLFLMLLKWWREIGFCSAERDGWKFIIPIFLLALLFLNLAWVFDESGKWFIGFESPLQLISLIGVMLLLGFVEEGIFRGVLFYGLSTQFTPLMTVVLTAVIFGLFHFVNLFTGAAFDQTLFQVIHASAMGFLYASLRLRIGAVWPLMLLHGFWDFSLFVLHSSHGEIAESSTGLTPTIGLTIALPALIYGIFVYWRWSRTQTNPESLCKFETG